MLELKEVDTAKVGGEVDCNYIDTYHEDDLNWFDIVKRLNIEIPIVIWMRGKWPFFDHKTSSYYISKCVLESFLTPCSDA